LCGAVHINVALQIVLQVERVPYSVKYPPELIALQLDFLFLALCQRAQPNGRHSIYHWRTELIAKGRKMTSSSLWPSAWPNLIAWCFLGVLAVLIAVILIFGPGMI
jgi:hypothetical protein